MKVLCVFGQHNYGDPERGLGYEYANFIPALKNLGHEVVFFESLNKAVYADYVDMNRQFLRMVERENPDIIFCVFMTYEIWLETLALVREGSEAALFHWATDDSWKYEQFSRFLAIAFDLYATTYESAMQKAASEGFENFTLSQWAADSSRLKPPIDSADCRYEVSFVGSTYGNRKQWVEDLQQRGIKVDTFGFGWPNGAVSLEDMSRIIRQSQISLNFGDSGVHLENGEIKRSRQIKARVFEVPGAGGLLLTEPAENLENFYRPGEEIVVFDGLEDLVDKVRQLLSDPAKRDRIVNAGYQRTQTEHTYESRFESLITSALERRKLTPPIRAGIDFDRFETIAKTHEPGFLLSALKYLLLLPSIALFGRRRGPRVARRALFEFSWRILGRKTYSVTNWAGRLFYRDS